MNKSELIEATATSADIPKSTAERAVNAILQAITTELCKGGTVSLVGFGSFQVNERAARTGRNPQSGETIQIKASKNPVFKPGSVLKNTINS